MSIWLPVSAGTQQNTDQAKIRQMEGMYKYAIEDNEDTKSQLTASCEKAAELQHELESSLENAAQLQAALTTALEESKQACAERDADKITLSKAQEVTM